MNRTFTHILLATFITMGANSAPLPKVQKCLQEIHPGETINDYYFKGKHLATEIAGNERARGNELAARKPCTRAGESLLHIQAVYDSEVVIGVKHFYVFLPDGTAVIDISELGEEDQEDISLPHGTYHFVTIFRGEDGCDRILLTENYEVSGEANVILDASVCTNYIQYRSLNPAGERFTSKVFRWDEASEDFIPTGEENTYGMCGSRYIFIDGVQMFDMTSFILQGTFILPDGTVVNSEDSADIYINDYSEKSGVVQTRFNLTDEGRFHILLAPKGCKSQVVINNPEEYQSFNPQYRDQKYPENVNKEGYACTRFSVTELGCFNGAPFGASQYNLNFQYIPGDASTYPQIQDTYWFCGEWPEWIESRPDLLPSKNLMAVPEEDRWGREKWNYYDLVIPPLHGVGEVTPYPYIFNYPHDLFNDKPNQDSSPRSYNLDYSFSLIEDAPVFGANVPVLEVMNQNAWVFGGSVPISEALQFRYHGIYGECDEMALHNAKCTNDINGKVESGYLNEVPLVGKFNPEVAEKGIISISTDAILIEDVEGRNETEIHWSHPEKDFPNIPTFRMLQMKDSEDSPKNFFETIEEAKATFSAGIFRFNADAETFAMWFDLVSCDMKVSVEVASHDSGNWETVEVKEIKEKFRMPGWGNYYESEFKDIKTVSPSGWYDLRLTLKLDDDNYQQQTLSPAFKVNAGEGYVETILENDKDGNSVYFDLLGNKVEHPSSGVYIMKKGEKVSKIAL